MAFTIDPKAYLAIGLQDDWMRIQDLNRDCLLMSALSSARARSVDAFVVPSAVEYTVTKGSLDDRFGFVRDFAQRTLGGLFVPLGNKDKAFGVRKARGSESITYVINGQVVKTKISGSDANVGLLVVGGNHFVSGSDPSSVAASAHSDGLSVILDQDLLVFDEKKMSLADYQAGLKWARTNPNAYDAVMGNYAQNTIPPALAGLANIAHGLSHRFPQINSHRGLDVNAKGFARAVRKPFISGSGAKRPEQVGVARTILDVNIPFSYNEDRILDSIRSGLANPKNVEGYITLDQARLFSSHWSEGMALRKSYQDSGRISPI
jgi:hypothetical protein